MYLYNATVLKIVDGDTAHFTIDLGLDTFQNHKCRFTGINAPELNTPEGQAAKEYLEAILPVGSAVVVKTEKDHQEKYGRYLVTIFFGDLNVNQQMVDQGHAVVYIP